MGPNVEIPTARERERSAPGFVSRAGAGGGARARGRRRRGSAGDCCRRSRRERGGLGGGDDRGTGKEIMSGPGRAACHMSGGGCQMPGGGAHWRVVVIVNVPVRARAWTRICGEVRVASLRQGVFKTRGKISAGTAPWTANAGRSEGPRKVRRSGQARGAGERTRGWVGRAVSSSGQGRSPFQS